MASLARTQRERASTQSEWFADSAVLHAVQFQELALEVPQQVEARSLSAVTHLLTQNLEEAQFRLRVLANQGRRPHHAVEVAQDHIKTLYGLIAKDVACNHCNWLDGISILKKCTLPHA